VTDQAAPEVSPADRRRVALQRNATQLAERTVARLQEGITSLTRAGLPITGPLIKQETGLDYKTIQRNPAAYALFCKHAAHFAQRPATNAVPRSRDRSRRRKQARSAVPRQPTPRDPLLERPKRRLVDRIRVLEAENAGLLDAAERLGLAQQEIEARNMELRSLLVAAQRNLHIVIAEHTRGNS
jgi:hypothetical protein